MQCIVIIDLLSLYILVNEISEFLILFLFCLSDGLYSERNTHKSKLAPLDLLKSVTVDLVLS